jgi:hypothetical protein
MKLPANDYLKYWRVIRYYMKAKHNISTPDLELILFLFSEDYFTTRKFKEYAELVRWERERFSRMIREGWIESFRKRDGNKAGLYKLSDKSRRIVLDIYRKLNGDEIPTTAENNPLFLKNVPYTHKVYRNMIVEMTKFSRQKVKDDRKAIKDRRDSTTNES